MMKLWRNLGRIAAFKGQINHVQRFSYFDVNQINNKLQMLVKRSQKKTSEHVRIWSVQSLKSEIEGGTFGDKPHFQAHINIFVNKHFSTLANLSVQSHQQTQSKDLTDQNRQTQKEKTITYKDLIETLNQSENCIFLPNLYNIFKRHTQRDSQKLCLLIGDYNQPFIEAFSQKTSQFLTLQELCAIYPEKVPLSYRSRQNIEKVKKNLQARLNISLSEEPKFSEILIINDKIKMWDQAYQITLDELPCKITVPFHYTSSNRDFKKLNMGDFIEGFKASHKIIHPNIPLEIEQQDIFQFLKQALGQSKPLLQKFKVEWLDPLLRSVQKQKTEKQSVESNFQN